MKTFKQFFENMDHSKDSQAVDELKSALLAKKDHINSMKNEDQVYDYIDKIMTRVAKSHSLSGQKLHDMWVKKYKEVPDTWIMDSIGESVKKPTGDLKSACWKGYTAVGMKMKNGRKVPNCVPTNEENVDEHIVKVKGGYELRSRKTGKNLGKYPTRAGAENRERQVQYFKHHGE
jgi:hypothetical protein